MAGPRRVCLAPCLALLPDFPLSRVHRMGSSGEAHRLLETGVSRVETPRRTSRGGHPRRGPLGNEESRSSAAQHSLAASRQAHPASRAALGSACLSDSGWAASPRRARPEALLEIQGVTQGLVGKRSVSLGPQSPVPNEPRAGCGPSRRGAFFRVGQTREARAALQPLGAPRPTQRQGG